MGENQLCGLIKFLTDALLLSDQQQDVKLFGISAQTLRSALSQTELTWHSHGTHTTLILHSQSTHTALTLHSQSAHTALTKRSQSTHTALTKHSHSTHTALTWHLHSIHTALTQHSFCSFRLPLRATREHQTFIRQY